MNRHTAHVEQADGMQTARAIEAPGIRSAHAHAMETLRDGETLRGVTEREPTHYGMDEIEAVATSEDEEGYRSATITLTKGDTALCLGTTKYVLAGVGEIEFLLHKSGSVSRPGPGVIRMSIR